MFDNYFGKTVQYEELYVDENNELKYKPAVTIKGSDIRAGEGSNSTSSISSLTDVKKKYRLPMEVKRRYRLPIKVSLGSRINGARVKGVYVRGFGNKIDFYLVDTFEYKDIVVVESDLTIECIVEHKIGLDALRNPVYSEPVVVKTWYFEDREIYKPNGDKSITSHTARAYILLPSVELNRGDKIDGYIVEEINIKHNADGSINHIEAYVCK